MELDDRLARTGVGAALALVSAYLVVTIARTTAPGSEGVVLLFGTVLPFVLATGGLAAGIAVAASDLDATDAQILGAWVAAGFAVTAGLTALVVLFERAHGVRLAHVAALTVNTLTGGMAVGILVGAFHVRSRARATALARQRDELELLNRILRHDVRNDLIVALATSEYLDTTVPDADREHYERLRRSLESAVRLADDVEDAIALLVADDDAFGRRPVAIRPIVDEQVDALRESYPGAEIRVGEVPEVRVVGHEMLATVVRNLLTNAVQHNPAPTPVVDVRVDDADGVVRVSVADDGPGVPADVRETLSDDGHGSLESDRTGIGLYLVTTVVRRCDGTVSVGESDLGGTRFTVALSKADADGAADAN